MLVFSAFLEPELGRTWLHVKITSDILNNICWKYWHNYFTFTNEIYSQKLRSAVKRLVYTFLNLVSKYYVKHSPTTRLHFWTICPMVWTMHHLLNNVNHDISTSFNYTFNVNCIDQLLLLNNFQVPIAVLHKYERTCN